MKAKAVGLDHVALFGVDHQARGDHRGLELEAFDRPALRQEVLFEVGDNPLFPFAHMVVDQGVIHVVAHGTDRSQIERPIAKNAAAIGGFR